MNIVLKIFFNVFEATEAERLVNYETISKHNVWHHLTNLHLINILAKNANEH